MRPLVLVHGAGANGAVWAPLVAALDGIEVHTPSLPGRPDGAPLDRAEDAAAWLATVIPAGAVVLGHSYGGAVAIALALASPDRLGGLILVSSGGRLRVHPALLEAAAAGPLSIGFASADRAVVEAYDRAASTTPVATALADWRACDAFDRLDQLGAIRVPALVLGGTEDVLTPPKYQRALAERIPGARLVLIDGAGHLAPWEQPARLAAEIRAFL